ncbi:serine/threonine-protein kinase [Streptomyces cavernae]|uniref:serine/threonine-protein kinase n=1 Tax=Streptomyces cavernae TaxID=2259034 RepID=UPI000FEB5D3C|nr:serine/threonine-protein kinase [Streptomyces cavernae]
MNARGEVVDERFELLEPLGSGGMGTVWRAWDTVLHRDVALKAVRSDAESSAAVRERVLREARALARISHPHVVTVHHIVDAEPHPWIVMELVPGRSLQERLDDGPLLPNETARVGRQVLSALRAAHAAGIRHRDVKPANILLRDDKTAVLTDFGIAALQGSTSLTATGELVGSPEYIAPEQIRGRGDGPASDLWSLGLVLYVCVEGVSPLRRETTLATLAAVLDDPVPPPVRSGPLAPVLQALLVRDPAARPDAGTLDAMLAQAESGGTADWPEPTSVETVDLSPVAPPTTVSPVPVHDVPPAADPGPHASTRADGTRPTAPAPPSGRWRRRAVVAAVAAVAAVAVGAVLMFAVGDDGGERRVADGGAGRGPASTSPSRTGPVPITGSGSGSPSPVGSPARGSTPQSGPADGSWIAQLHSEPVSAGTAARDQQLATVRQSVPEAQVLRSDDYASLRPGYWVIYAPGPFDDGRAALAFCAERGRTSSTACLGRVLSGSTADFGLQCVPPAASPVGRCTRS